MLEEIDKARIVITNFHAFQLREVMNTSKVSKALLQGRDQPLHTTETEGLMIRRVAKQLMGFKNIAVINDETPVIKVNLSEISLRNQVNSVSYVLTGNS